MLLNKQQTSLVVKIVALIVAIAFVVGIVIPMILTPKNNNQNQTQGLSSEDEARYRQNVSKLTQVLSQNPNDLNTLIQLGNEYYDWAEAYKRAKPDSTEAIAKFQQAIYYYQRALEIDPKNTDVRTDMAVASFYSGDAQKAINEANRVITEKPDHAIAYYNLGIFYTAVDKKSEAIQAWEKYLALEPNGEHADFVKSQLAKLKQG